MLCGAFFCAKHKSQAGDLTDLLLSIHTGVYTGRIYAGMPQQVGQMAQILRRFVIQTGKQMTKIMGKNLAGIYPGGRAQHFHLMEDVASVHWIPAPCNEYAAALNAAVFHKPFQRLAQWAWKEHLPRLSFQRHGCISPVYCLHRYEPQFTDTDARGADRLH